ncbi:MAG TPA: hypothetical protein VHX42_02750 [Candidatus Babeliales bacterium]|jgi:hypothetical protein|nr:hypothetical protein [Candidatus Babeliales bacterium]
MIYLLLVLSVLFTHNGIHGTSFGSSTKDIKQPVNFSGKISTHQGQEYIVDNISIDNKYKEIIMYAKPTTHAKAVMNQDSQHLEIKLTENPTTDFVKDAYNLEQIKEIQVPSPNTMWYYQKKANQQKMEYVEVVIISKSNTKSYHLLEHRAQIYCDVIDAGGSQEKIIPLAALKSLTIEGYAYRDTSKERKECQPCAAAKQ